MTKEYSVLIVDDEEKTSLYLAELLNIYFPHITKYFAKNGEEALFILKDSYFPLIFLDITMPGMDGIELLEILRKKGLDSTVIIISAHANFEYAQQGIRLGVQDYLLKPISPSALKKCIEAFENTRTDNSSDKIPATENLQTSTQIKFPSPTGYEVIDINNISLAEISGRNKMDIYLASGEVFKQISFSMKDLENKLPENFIRISRLHMANLKYIKSFSSKEKIITISIHDNQKKIKCSRQTISYLTRSL